VSEDQEHRRVVQAFFILIGLQASLIWVHSLFFFYLPLPSAQKEMVFKRQCKRILNHHIVNLCFFLAFRALHSIVGHALGLKYQFFIPLPTLHVVSSCLSNLQLSPIQSPCF
jgi:hypothetical protein